MIFINLVSFSFDEIHVYHLLHYLKCIWNSTIGYTLKK